MTVTYVDVAVIGGGAAGMAAGLFSAKVGAETLILEKNEKLGRKMYITGKGRCNLTNNATREEFLNEVPRNPKFLYSAIANLTPQDVMRLVEENGCPVKTERGRRVFPVSDKASDVTRAFQHALTEAGCLVRLNSAVTGVTIDTDGSFVLQTQTGTVHAGALVIATGGLSYPATGSTGDGYAFAEKLGIPLQPRHPSLIPLLTSNRFTGELQGLSLKNVRLTAGAGKKSLYSELGEMLFTEDGVSGPLVLELSCHLPHPLPENLQVSIDLKPGLTLEQLRNRLQREITAAGKKSARTVMETLLPQRLAVTLLDLAQIDPMLQANQLNAAQRDSLCDLLKAFPLHISGTKPIAEAVVTRGGVDIKALVPGTMAVRNIENLFFCGEVIDVDAHTGGYNLQIAFSTGALAGKNAAETALRRKDY